MLFNNYKYFTKKIIMVIIFLPLLFSTLISGIIDEVESKLIAKYNNATNIEYNIYDIPQGIKKEIQYSVRQKFFRDKIHFWKINIEKDIVYTAILDNTIGKSMPITFLVIISNEGNILDTEIIKYREPYGGEISNKKWTSQFIGKNIKSNFIIGKDIQGITGATISVHSVNKGVQKLIKIYPSLINNR